MYLVRVGAWNRHYFVIDYRFSLQSSRHFPRCTVRHGSFDALGVVASQVHLVIINKIAFIIVPTHS